MEISKGNTERHQISCWLLGRQPVVYLGKAPSCSPLGSIRPRWAPFGLVPRPLGLGLVSRSGLVGLVPRFLGTRPLGLCLVSLFGLVGPGTRPNWAFFGLTRPGTWPGACTGLARVVSPPVNLLALDVWAPMIEARLGWRSRIYEKKLR